MSEVNMRPEDELFLGRESTVRELSSQVKHYGYVCTDEDKLANKVGNVILREGYKIDVEDISGSALLRPMLHGVVFSLTSKAQLKALLEQAYNAGLAMGIKQEAPRAYGAGYYAAKALRTKGVTPAEAQQAMDALWAQSAGRAERPTVGEE